MIRKCTYITILLLTFYWSSSHGQDSIRKNTMTYFIVPVPALVLFTSLTYERFINQNNSFALTLKVYSTDFLKVKSWDYSVDTWFALCPSYRHYTYQPNSKRVLNWVSLFFPISFHKWDSWTHTHFAPMIDKGSHKNIGIGGLVGKRIKLGADKRFFLDLGIGLAYYFVKGDFNNVSEESFEHVAPKFILIFGNEF
jgi:hypothetical protein